jgi:NADH:ubiquinone oxidoreductase subunit F (NADH-binding)
MTGSRARLLAGIRSDRPLSFDEHLAVHGPLAALEGPAIIEAAGRAGILGRGGAGFPMERKLRAVAERGGRKVVVANGVEAEPMSAKDRVLLASAPHLVLDGVAAAAMAVGAREAIVCVPATAPVVRTAVEDAVRERRDWGRLRLRVAPVPPRYVAGEETALIHHLDGGPLKPTFTPPRPFERGVGRRPTLVQNVETLAHLALVARHGPRWFRQTGRQTSPGTMLVTLGGAVHTPGVIEVPGGTTLADALMFGGGPSEEIDSVVVGGYFGAWLPAPSSLGLALDERELGHHGAAVGAGVIVAMPSSSCGVAELARVVSWLAGQSARQCGPCANGLPAIAGALNRIAVGRAERGSRAQLLRWAGMVRNRGACRHPDGVVRLLTSALRTLDEDLRDHELNGPCDACARPPLLATPTPEALAA